MRMSSCDRFGPVARRHVALEMWSTIVMCLFIREPVSMSRSGHFRALSSLLSHNLIVDVWMELCMVSV